MKRKQIANRLALASVLTGAAVGIAACGPQTVYGPPPDDPHVYEEPDDIDEAQDDYDPELEEIEDVYGPPPDDYDPEFEEIEAVYGPPPDLEQDPVTPAG